MSKLRREVSLLCDASGVVMQGDESATRLLGVEPGESLISHAAPGAAGKLTRLFELGGQGRVHDRETCLVVEGTPRTYCSLSSLPGQSRVARWQPRARAI